MEPVDLCPVTTLLSRGGILYGISGEDKTTALMAAVEALALPNGVDRDLVIDEILKRENIASTGIGQGIALPHPQSAPALQLPKSILTLLFLQQPIDFDAPDGVPVQALFMILSRDAGQHLRLLAHLGRTLQNKDVLDALNRQLPADEILAIFGRAEKSMHDRHATGHAR